MQAHKHIRTDIHPVVRNLLEGGIDYAGLFPPANLMMEHAVRNYAAYRTGTDVWALGRFVTPAARLNEFAAAANAAGATDRPWPVSAILGTDLIADLRAVGEFNRTNAGQFVVDSVEGKVADPKTIRALADERAEGILVYCELVPDETLPDFLDTVAASGLRAKIRTGGVTARMIPAADRVLHFLRACVERSLPFKATAGLHHPVRAEYPLTYEVDSPRGTMYGYLNVLLATAALCSGADAAKAEAVLTEQTAEAIHPEGDVLRWNKLTFDAASVHRARALMIGFGSCSFREPIDELHAIGLL